MSWPHFLTPCLTISYVQLAGRSLKSCHSSALSVELSMASQIHLEMDKAENAVSREQVNSLNVLG